MSGLSGSTRPGYTGNSGLVEDGSYLQDHPILSLECTQLWFGHVLQMPGKGSFRPL